MSLTVKVNMKPGWDKRVEASLKTGVLSMITDVQRRSHALAPKLTGVTSN